MKYVRLKFNISLLPSNGIFHSKTTDLEVTFLVVKLTGSGRSTSDHKKWFHEYRNMTDSYSLILGNNIHFKEVQAVILFPSI